MQPTYYGQGGHCSNIDFVMVLRSMLPDVKYTKTLVSMAKRITCIHTKTLRDHAPVVMVLKINGRTPNAAGLERGRCCVVRVSAYVKDVRSGGVVIVCVIDVLHVVGLLGRWRRKEIPIVHLMHVWLLWHTL